jgi:hypothetical protein
MSTAATQAAAWKMRRANRSRFYTSQATPWSAGLVVTAGDIVQSHQLAWKALNSGTTGTSAPNNSSGAASNDGAVTWVHVPLLLVAPAAV